MASFALDLLDASGAVWDPEMSNVDRNDKRRFDSTPRMEMLKSYFLKN